MRGYAALGLHHPKSQANVAGVLRAAAVYGAVSVAVEGQRYRKHPADPNLSWRHLPLLHGNLHELVPYDAVPVAVDLVSGARSLHGYTHPERAFYVFGPEDGTLGAKVLSWCRDVIYIPTEGGCMNLAACVNVVLYDRSKKRMRNDRLLEGYRARPELKTA